ncbi:hypothetical protein CK203_102009 [Vitis vinifera]|uniref:Reverse transcriptase RNase H-like domain-containing protein n=1 Tax=Vitis vinifera TaxID=29760 RepID=A0A438D8J4_VITVI|nr:hypothetical protein CK203_102009 [Vitis vinifera]
MVERIMEVFMDDHTVYGKTFDDCRSTKIELISKLPSPTTIKEDAEFIWTKACQEAFERLNAFLTTAPIWESYQRDGKPYVVNYASKTLNDAQKNYTTTENELLVVAFALDKIQEPPLGTLIINDEFPDDALCAVEKLPWFTNIVNYLATGRASLIMEHGDEEVFLSRAKHYAWDDPYLYKFFPDQIIRRCVPKDEQQDIL